MNKRSELIIDFFETKRWRLNGKLHREDGPACEWINGDKYWYINGELHREDGPAIEYADGDKAWYVNNKKHRTDGPAIERHDGAKSWYLSGIRYFSFEEWFQTLTPEQQYNYLWSLDVNST